MERERAWREAKQRRCCHLHSFDMFVVCRKQQLRSNTHFGASAMGGNRKQAAR